MEGDPTEDGHARLYRTVRLIRRFEERAIDLVRSGDIPGIHPCIGQEAAAAGVCAALRPDDVVLSNHRGHGHLLAKGCDPGRLMAELLGRVTGVGHGGGGSLHPADLDNHVYGATATVGHGAAIASGVGWALAKQGGGRLAVAFFGDGAVNQGALLEAFNLASLWRVPVLLVCENNSYATTLAAGRGNAGSVVGRAEGFGIPASTVDGQDPVLVRKAARQAVHRARTGGGPSVLELLTYRYEGHHTFELRTRLRYRDKAEVERWRERDPLRIQGERVRAEKRKLIDAEVEATLEKAVRSALNSPAPDPTDPLRYLYADGLRTRGGVSHA
ncbi:thiamine pyrophosphate-dependent dehydrogenase E1 component subunit alpha [Micromonospora eburnea]|uniref:Pyruvate dehydrogenase E1 component alpha subunit n=1 Tax=Micromonospora eburnea TaxID=227316 RepID=A0A1C6V0V5_9ACTN|nr:thiamine pyrophosphate-dependent dehydrogenase E1 component subunit alpha [Micromonospora eburnea]SCL59744.1 pyruvate dehydrogenase E1 component alpha subunit [Micromonospora eburnea]